MNRLLPALSDPPDRLALRFGDDRLGYPELAAVAGALAVAVAGCGRVAVHATPTLHTAVGVVAGLLAGVPAVPMNPRLGERELAHVLADSAPDVVLAAPGVALPGPLAALRRIDIDLTATGTVSCAEPPPDAPALVVYTSGTTGMPKGALLSRGAIASNLDALAGAWDWTAGDLLAHALPLFHVHGLVLGVLGPLRRGGSLHHVGVLDADALAAAGASMVFGVPTQYHRLAGQLESDRAAAAAIGSARLLVSGSAALTAVDHARLRRLTGHAVRERYGLTETLILTAARAGDEPEPGTVGRPLPGTYVRLVPLPGDRTDGLGAVEARGPGLFDGYLNRPDATAAARTPDGWFATGDIGRWTATGALALVGRSATDLIKSGGYKIGAGEIENALLEHAGVAEAAVIGVPDDDLGERIVAFVVPVGAAPPERELVDHVATLLAPHKRPREVRFTDALPRNDMGKIVKGRLPAIDSSAVRASRPMADRLIRPAVAGAPGSAGAVLVDYLATHLDRLAAEEARVRRDEPDAVHQLRVASRRIRSALQAYRPLLDRERTEPLVDGLRRFGQRLAPARDTEVLHERIAGGLAALGPELLLGPVQAQVTRHSSRLEAETRAAVLGALDGAGYAQLRVALDELVQRPPLTKRAARPARKELPTMARRTARKLERAVATATGGSVDERDAAVHAARKAGKRLRYATEVARPAVGRDAKRFTKALKEFQSALGEHQDTVVARGALRELGARGKNGFSFGVLYGRDATRAAQIEEGLPALWAAAWTPRARRWLR